MIRWWNVGRNARCIWYRILQMSPNRITLRTSYGLMWSAKSTAKSIRTSLKSGKPITNAASTSGKPSVPVVCPTEWRQKCVSYALAASSNLKAFGAKIPSYAENARISKLPGAVLEPLRTRQFEITPLFFCSGQPDRAALPCRCPQRRSHKFTRQV